MWLYVADIQRDFAARVAWAADGSYEKGEHSPKLSVEQGVDITAAKGDVVTLTASAENPDKLDTAISFRVYKDASAYCAADVKLEVSDNTAKITIPESAKSGDLIHIMVKAESKGHYRLFDYKQVIITIK